MRINTYKHQTVSELFYDLHRGSCNESTLQVISLPTQPGECAVYLCKGSHKINENVLKSSKKTHSQYATNNKQHG